MALLFLSIAERNVIMSPHLGQTYCFSHKCLSVRLSICSSVCLSVGHKSCPLNNSKTV